MVITLLRLYLLAGLVLHKAVWEVLKRNPATSIPVPRQGLPARVRILKLIKLAVLLGLVTQTFLPTILPIAEDPRVLQAVGVSLYTLGLAVALAARWQLGGNWSDIEVGSVRKDHAIVCSGVYRYIRHPIYTGDILLILGFELALNSWLVLGVVPIAGVAISRALAEEQSLARSLSEYDQYRARTKRFVPFIY